MTPSSRSGMWSSWLRPAPVLGPGGLGRPGPPDDSKDDFSSRPGHGTLSFFGHHREGLRASFS
jgi:hypothetical protein